MHSTDESLFAAHRRGETEAFGELVRRYGDSVLGYLMRMTHNREQAEDCFQETFRRVHEKAHTFRGRRFKSWLFSIATNVAIDGLRKRRRARVVSLNQPMDCPNDEGQEYGAVAVAQNSCDPVQEAIRLEQKQQVRRAVGSLPAQQQATLVLAYYEQLTYREVAEILGCSVGAVKTQMYRALRALEKQLPDIGEGVA